MALQTQNQLLQREKRILVAIEVAARKMEMLSMISTLCHHFSAATVSSNRNQGCCWLDQLNSVLGRDAVDVLQEFVTCQKKYYGPSHTQVVNVHDLRKTMTREEIRKDLIGRLKQAPDKRKYLKEVMTRTKAVLNEENAISCSDKAKIAKPVYSSALDLLRAALNSKYRPHVRRCFEEQDVESLMSILYLILHVSTPSTSAAEQFAASQQYSENWRTELSSHSSVALKDPVMGQDEESRFYAASPVTSLSLSWDGEETVIDLIDELGDTPSHPFHETPERTEISELNNESEIVYIPEIKEKQFISTTTEVPASTSSLVVTTTPGNWDHVEMQASTFRDLSCCVKYDLMEKDIMELYEKLVNAISNFSLESIAALLLSHKDECTNRINSSLRSEAQHLFETFEAFCLLVEKMFTQNKNTDTLSSHTDMLNKLTIELQILSIEENEMKKNLNQVMAAHSSLVESLDAQVLDWKCQVEDVQRNIGLQHRNTVKNYVAAELSIEKNRQRELTTFKRNLATVNDSLSRTTGFVRQTVKSLRARRHYLEASLESLMRQYDATMLKYQVKIDELGVEEGINNKLIEKLQNKFKNVEEMYDEMRAMKRLKQLLQNMEKAEAIKQNWAARKIQVAWRKYKVAKLRKKKLKGRKKGKKKTPPPGKGTSPPTKASTPGSRSKSQTP